MTNFDKFLQNVSKDWLAALLAQTIHKCYYCSYNLVACKLYTCEDNIKEWFKQEAH